MSNTITIPSALEEVAAALQPLNSPQKVEEVTGIPVNTLAFWRCEGSHLAFVKMGRKVCYRREDILHYIETHTFNSSNEAKEKSRTEK
ncbi:hypothetical protein OZX73_03465 [Bifidobacterium sp. ESL0775]|uniref:hypothetical protein n=1 Tax=Bifidobacterium sp. ESL0775 TaxID=2983230 RepID=UPI0023F61F27|nr:hypothetical protein [Bifidobacterium sp. ESL0775]WEV69931.1 hypothetical protein OZX73_03465 [Bifidobacterium sp. ESL0775]